MPHTRSRAQSAESSWPEPIEAFLGAMAGARQASEHTVAAYRHDLQVLMDWCMQGGMSWDALTVADVRRAMAQLHARGLSPTSIARTLSSWRSAWRWMLQHGHVRTNPVVGVRAPRRAKRLPKALSVEAAVQLSTHPVDGSPQSLRDRALVELMYSSGLRLAETVALDWQYFRQDPLAGLPASIGWIDLEAAQVTVCGKGRKTRVVPMGQAAVAALRAWLAERHQMHARAPSDPRALFLSARGQRLAARSVRARLAGLAKRLGLGVHVHPHMLRHSMASHVLQSSGDLRAVQELLGHAQITTTQMYTQLDFQHLAKVYEAAHPLARKKTS